MVKRRKTQNSRKKNEWKYNGSGSSRHNGQKKTEFSVNWPEWAVQAYLFMMLGVFPLYFQDKFFHLGDVKYIFFRTVTILLMAVLSIELAVIGILKVYCSDRGMADCFQSVFRWGEMKKRLKRLSVTDIGMLVWLGFALLSWILSEDREAAWIGAPNWYMGLLTQLLLVGVYFAVSRFCSCREWLFWVMAGSGGLVFLTAYLHRFSIDPFGLRDGKFDLGYLGPIGNANFHSTYVCILLSVMMGVYVILRRERTKEARLRRGMAALVIFLGFCTAVTQNSDSIYVGLGITFLFLLWFALEDGIVWKRYMELWILAVSAARVTGVLQNAFPEKVPLLNRLSLAVTKVWAGWLVLAAVLLAYGGTCLALKRGVKTGNMIGGKAVRLRGAVFVPLAAGAVCMLILMGLSITGIFPRADSEWQERLSELIWRRDNGRRTIWTLCADAFGAYPLFRKLFGCGPDLLGCHLETYHGALVQAVWGEAILRNAHNEWLNSVMNYGILGGGAYLFLFAAASIRCIKNRKRQPVLLAAAAAIPAYMGHDFFCFQQTVCAPLIFIVIGMAESLMRKNLHRKPAGYCSGATIPQGVTCMQCVKSRVM